jgi:hypothetical protein
MLKMRSKNKCNQEELKVEETNEVGMKVKSMNNKERHD